MQSTLEVCIVLTYLRSNEMKIPRYNCFSCAAAFAYEALAGRPLLPVGFDLEDYNGKLAALHQAPMPGAPVLLLPTLQPMLAQSPSLRPPAVSFTAAGYFQVRRS